MSGGRVVRGKKRRVYLWVPHPDGGRALFATGTSNPKRVAQIETMVSLLADERKHHYVLRAIHGKRVRLKEAFEAWAAGTLDALLEERKAPDLLGAPFDRWVNTLVAEFGAESDTAYRYPLHARQILERAVAEHGRTPSPADLEQTILADPVKPGTRVRKWAAVRSYSDYLLRAGVIGRALLDGVPRPGQEGKRESHITRAQWLALVEKAEGQQRTAEVLAHLAFEMSAILRTRRSDVDLAAETVHAHGTKTEHRDRLCVIHPWALPYLRDAVQGLAPDDFLVTLTGDQIRIEHRRLCVALGLGDYRIHDARHTYAVYHISAGVPAEVIAAQTGHASPHEVSTRYGRYQPKLTDRRRWASLADAFHATRRAEESESGAAEHKPQHKSESPL